MTIDAADWVTHGPEGFMASLRFKVFFEGIFPGSLKHVGPPKPPMSAGPISFPYFLRDSYGSSMGSHYWRSLDFFLTFVLRDAGV